MATLIDFTKSVKLLTLHSKKTLGMYRHSGDKYPGLHLTIGARKSAWSFRGRINGQVRSKNLGTFPEMNVQDAFEKMNSVTAHKGNVASAEIKTVRDAWLRQCATRLAAGKTSQKTVDDLTTKLERYAPNILKKDPLDVSFEEVQATIEAVKTTRGDGTATKRHVSAALFAAFKRARVPNNPTVGVELPAAKERPPEWYVRCDENKRLDPEDWSVMWGAIMQQREANVLKGVAWVVMLFTGIRAGNVLSLRWEPEDGQSYVDLQRKEIHLARVKSGLSNVTMPICDTVVAALMSIRSYGSPWVFPAKTKSGHIDQLRALSAHVEGEQVRVAIPHDSRKLFQDACIDAMLSEIVMHRLRGDKQGGRGNDMLNKYTTRVGRTAPTVVESVILERIKTTPSFVD